MLRNINKKDITQLHHIEEKTQFSPWSEETFKKCMGEGYPGWVIEKENRVIGFVMFSVKVGECHILNIGVLPECQHQGYGKQLLGHALDEAKKLGAGIAYLEVRKLNSKAIAMYKKFGFTQIGERKNYYVYPQGAEDALIFAKDLQVKII